MQKQVRLGLIGAGAVARLMHIPVLLQLGKKFKITAVCDINKKALAQAKKFFPSDELPDFTSDARDIFKRNDTDAVAVFTPTSTHVNYTISALKNKKYVFLEKPAAVNTGDIKKIRSAEKTGRRYVQVGMVLRYSSFYNAVLKIISGGEYGKVLWMNWLETRPFDPMLWRYNNVKQNGDAVIHDKAIHQINLFNAFAGSKPAYVSAFGGQYLINNKTYSKVRAFTKTALLKGASNDHLMSVICYKNGVKASLTISYVSPQARESRWVIQLEKAKIIAHFETFVSPNNCTKRSWHNNPSAIYLFKDDKNYSVPWHYPMSYPPSDARLVFYDENKKDPLHPGSRAQWLAFYDTVTLNKKPFCSTRLAEEDAAVCDAMVRSIKQNKVISIK